MTSHDLFNAVHPFQKHRCPGYQPSITDPFDPKEVASAVADPWDFFDLHWDASQWQILGIGTRPGKRLHNYGKIHHFQWDNPL